MLLDESREWHEKPLEKYNVLPPLSWYKLPSGTQSLIFMSDDNLTETPINQHVNYWYNWEVYDITPTFTNFARNCYMKIIWYFMIKNQGNHLYFNTIPNHGDKVDMVTRARILTERQGYILCFYYVRPWCDTWTESHKQFQRESVEGDGKFQHIRVLKSYMYISEV